MDLSQQVLQTYESFFQFSESFFELTSCISLLAEQKVTGLVQLLHVCPHSPLLQANNLAPSFPPLLKIDVDK